MEVNRRKQSWPGRKAGAGGWKGRPPEEEKRSRDPENEEPELYGGGVGVMEAVLVGV